MGVFSVSVSVYIMAHLLTLTMQDLAKNMQVCLPILFLKDFCYLLPFQNCISRHNNRNILIHRRLLNYCCSPITCCINAKSQFKCITTVETKWKTFIPIPTCHDVLEPYFEKTIIKTWKINASFPYPSIHLHYKIILLLHEHPSHSHSSHNFIRRNNFIYKFSNICSC